MSILVSDQDINKIRDATSQVLKDTIGQIASVLVPAIGTAAGNALGGIEVKITLGPIKIEPIEIVVGVVGQKENT